MPRQAVRARRGFDARRVRLARDRAVDAQNVGAGVCEEKAGERAFCFFNLLL